MQTSIDRPRFRQDLVAEPIEDGGGKFIDVMDPDSGQLFRFFEVEYSLACAMDGERDVAGIVKWAEEELGLKPSPNEVRIVVATLGDLGFLERGAAAAAAVNAAAAAEAPRAAEPARPAEKAQPPARSKTPPAGVPAATAKTAPAKAPVAAASTKQDDASFNRWDQPTAMGDSDDYLAPGVSAGKGRAATPAPDVELGTPGARAAGRGDDLPRAPDLELGAPGAAAGASARGGRGEDVALGAPGAAPASSVSTDLAADMPIGRNDVKEAVRASQVMKSVDVPPELAAELEPPKPATKQPEAASKRAPTPAPVAETKPARPEPTPAPKKPIELPTERPVLPKAPTAPSPGVSPILIALLVLAILGAGGFLIYKYVIKKSDSTANTKVTPKVEPAKPLPPPPPPVETAKLATEQPAAEEIKPSGAATVATIVASDTAIKAGEPIARLVGFKPLETETTNLKKDIDKLKTDITNAEKARDAATTAGNKNGITQAENKIAGLQKTLGTKETTLATKTTALDKFLIRAPADGKVTAVAKANAKVTPTDIIATLTRDPILVATFKTAPDATPDAKVLLAIKGSEQKLSCTVVATGGDGTKIACPKDAAPEGSEVTYAGLDPAAPPPGETPPTGTDTGTGSDTGSAATEPATPGDKPADPASGSADADKPADAPTDAPAEPKAEKPAPKAQPKPRPRPRPQPKPPADKPADAPAEPEPAPAPEPAPSGGGLQ